MTPKSIFLLSFDILPLPSNPYLPHESGQACSFLFSIIIFGTILTPTTLPTKRLPSLLLSFDIHPHPSHTPTYQTTPKSTFLLSFDILPLPSNPYLPHESGQACSLLFSIIILDTILTPTTLPTKRLPSLLFFYLLISILIPATPLPTKRLPSLLFFYLLISFLSPATPTYHTNPAKPALFSLV